MQGGRTIMKPETAARLLVTRREAVRVGFGAAAAALLPASATTLRMMYPIRVPSPDYAFIWAGDELGYFREEGLKLDIQPTAGSVDSVRLTAVGQGDLSVAGCDGVVIGRTQGQNMRCCFVHAQR